VLVYRKMQPDFAFFARNAGFLQDGALCVYGANIDALHASVFPTPPIHLSLVASLKVAPDEPLENHFFRVDLVPPDGERRNVLDRRPIKATRNKYCPSDPSVSQVVVSLQASFFISGKHLFIVVVDDQDAFKVPVYLVQT